MQEAWKNLQQQSITEADTGSDGTLLLRVIANSAARFPAEQAAHLAANLLQVGLDHDLLKLFLGIPLT